MDSMLEFSKPESPDARDTALALRGQGTDIFGAP